MQSLMPTTPDALSTALEEITAIDRESDTLELKLKELKKRRDYLEGVALEEFSLTRQDGVRVAGRSWRIASDHLMSVPKDRRDAVLAAAEAAGITDTVIAVQVATLKSWLKANAEERGMDASVPFSEGTPFEGLVGECVVRRLRHLTVG